MENLNKVYIIIEDDPGTNGVEVVSIYNDPDAAWDHMIDIQDLNRQMNYYMQESEVKSKYDRD